MSHSFNTISNKGSNQPPVPPPMKTYCSSIQITPSMEPHGKKISTSTSNQQNGSYPNPTPNPNPQGTLFPRKTSDSLLVATVDGKAVGGGPGVLYSAINGNNIQSQNGTKVNPSDPQVRKLVYNMYRELLSTKHDRANNIVGAAPGENVTTDEGVGDRIVSMMRHQSERESKMMNLGPPPPPPPPPFSTGAPAPSPRQPMEVPTKAPPPVAVPAALAGAMMKDRKPFTYTPGGLNLAEINAQNPAQQNGAPFIVQQGGPQDPVMQSRSFKVLQNVYDHQEPTGNQVEENSTEPKKYMGSHIPSRSFRMLQAMTDDDTNSTCSEEKLRHHEISAQEDGTNISSKSINPMSSLSRSSLSSITPLSSSASITSIDKSSDIGSRVAPSYTSTNDSHVYRHVAPKIISAETDRVVNSALCARRDSSPRPWQKESSTFTRSFNNSNEQSGTSPAGLESPSRLLNIIKQETSDSGSESSDNKLLYGGSSIPSKVFRQLQSDYSNRNNGNVSPVSGSNTPPSNRITEVHIPRLMQQLRVDERNPSVESTNSIDDQYVGVLETASAKESVLKELTSQFDPQTSLKKPRAAPGRVFKYLQQQYDDPQDSDFVSSSSHSMSNNASPSNACFSSASSGIESGQCDAEPKPYSGCRIPGRSFRLLQENMETHPSVLQARK